MGRKHKSQEATSSSHNESAVPTAGADSVSTITVESTEFRAWLKAVKSKNPDEISRAKADRLLEKFLRHVRKGKVSSPLTNNQSSAVVVANSQETQTGKRKLEHVNDVPVEEVVESSVGDAEPPLEKTSKRKKSKKEKMEKKENKGPNSGKAGNVKVELPLSADGTTILDNGGDRPQKLQEPEPQEQHRLEAERISRTGNVSILLFYAYCPLQMSRGEQDEAISFCYNKLSELDMTGRLRVGREGYNCTLTGTQETVRAFTAALRDFDPNTFGKTDFKYVDGLPDNQRLKGLKVWPVTEIVTYGFDPKDAPLDKRGTHLTPTQFHEALMDPNTVVIDVRNFNETAIGKFAPQQVLSSSTSTITSTSDGAENNTAGEGMATSKGDSNSNSNRSSSSGDGKHGSTIGATVLDPCMRRSTEFPGWVQEHKPDFEGKRVLMYCTAGVRCERASAFLQNQGIKNVYQLEGGIHRYLEAFPDDGGFWVGKNYTFDKRFSHGADKADVISHCVHCGSPWERYQAQAKCCRCSMEVLLCKTCQRQKPAVPKYKLVCSLCCNPSATATNKASNTSNSSNTSDSKLCGESS